MDSLGSYIPSPGHTGWDLEGAHKRVWAVGLGIFDPCKNGSLVQALVQWPHCIYYVRTSCNFLFIFYTTHICDGMSMTTYYCYQIMQRRDIQYWDQMSIQTTGQYTQDTSYVNTNYLTIHTNTSDDNTHRIHQMTIQTARQYTHHTSDVNTNHQTMHKAYIRCQYKLPDNTHRIHQMSIQTARQYTQDTSDVNTYCCHYQTIHTGYIRCQYKLPDNTHRIHQMTIQTARQYTQHTSDVNTNYQTIHTGYIRCQYKLPDNTHRIHQMTIQTARQYTQDTSDDNTNCCHHQTIHTE